MKRGAERQLTKDGTDEEEIEEIQDPQRFRKADEATLAKRQIRALPKRVLATSKPPALNGLSPPDADKVEAAPKFGGFAGFGAGTSASNTFTFAAQPPTVPTSSEFDTTSKSTQPTPVAVSPFLGAPKPGHLDSDAFPPKPEASTPAEGTDSVAFKYFKSLRGLNVSFLSAISSAVEKDPFCDVANLVESYKNLRTTIQSEFDSTSQPSTTRGPVTTNSLPIFDAKAPPERTTLFSMPKPPAGSAEAPFRLSSTSESGTKTGGFTFPPFVPPSSSASTQLPFGVTPKSSEPSTRSSATAPEHLKSAASSTPTSTSSLPLTAGFTFAATPIVESTAFTSAPGSSTQEGDGSSASSWPRPTSTAPSLGPGSSIPNFFATTKPTSAFGITDAASKPTSAFGSSMSGSSTVFGIATGSSTSTSIFRSSSDKPVSVFGSASSPKTGAFIFGKPAGSIGNPVGFGFGSSSPSTGDATIPGSSSSGFNFGLPSMKPTESLFSPPMTDKSSESTPQPEAEGNEEGGEEETVKLLPSYTHDEEGEGEEDEETTHVVRCKVYRLFKAEDNSEWKDLGVGMFRLKKHKETNVRRALMRNSNTGRILVNFRITTALKPTLAKNAVSFVGDEGGTLTSFSVRVKTEEQAKDLKQALEQEVAVVQAAE